MKKKIESIKLAPDNAYEEKPDYATGIYCRCGKRTKGGKPVCVDHVMDMPYAQAVSKRDQPRGGARPLAEITPKELSHYLAHWSHLE